MSAWTDRERLVYLWALMETSSPKLDYSNTPRPNGRSIIACQRMVDRLKVTLKDDLAALKADQNLDGGTGGDGKGTPKTPKRKAKVADIEENGSPKAKSRKPNVNKMEIKEELELDNEF